MSDELDKTADAGTGGAPTQIKAGNQLGKYRLDRVLGEGGMGVVWAAHDPDLERSVAIKVLRYAQASTQLRQRLLREARAMAKLKHPNVLTVYEVGTVGDRDYIAMELVDGMTLDQWLALGPTPDEIWHAVIAAGRGLAAAHEAGVVHRDFKPHNVLRSREGRVLVTDFGLARGMLAEDEAPVAEMPQLDPNITPFDETIEAVSNSNRKAKSLSGMPAPRPSDAVLDGSLTQTGALIGTPAYMAPEQYLGAPPDPRTDQFGFCVTAWQALTGERPFKGQSLDEMRKSVGAGVAHIETKLPRRVRAVLTRGLDPKADQRWPSLEVLLDELERAAKLPAVRRRLIAIAAATVVAVGVLVMLQLANRRGEPAKDTCDAPAAEFAEAWSPAVKSELGRNAPAAAFARVSDVFDRYAKRWADSYTDACQSRPAKNFRARIGCLEGVRDLVSSLTYMLRDADPRVFEVLDLHGMLPAIATCEIAQPYAPPQWPREQPRRDQSIKLIARTIGLRGIPTAGLRPAIDELLREAQALRAPPLLAAVRVVSGNELLRRGQIAEARELYRSAKAAESSTPAAQRDRRIEAMTRLGILDAALHELEEPAARVPAGIDDPAAKPVLHPELVEAVTAVRSSTTTDPALGGNGALLAAKVYLHLAQFNRYRQAYQDALSFAGQARKLFESVGDTSRVAAALSTEAQIYLQRGDDRALDDAMFAARRAADALELAQLPPHPELDLILAQVAYMRGSYSEFHRLVDSRARPEDVSALPLVKGRVTPAGPNTTVVAWRGDLIGDPRRVFTDARRLSGDVVTAAADGSFEIHAEPGWAVMAESKAGRSTPQVIGKGPVAIELKPTTTLSGTINGRNYFGVRAWARFTAGTARWFLEVPIERDGVFDLRGLPPGTPVFGTRGEAGSADRNVIAGPFLKDVSWPHGQTVEIIVRGKVDETSRAWLIRRANIKPDKRADLEAIVATDNVASGPLVRIGADNLDASRDIYRAGDVHLVITGNPADEYTACIAPTATSPIKCKTFSVEVTAPVDYPDGRFGAGATPILFEL